MPDTQLPVLNDTAHVMLAAFGSRSTLANFQVAVAMRPEFEYDEAGCLTGLETLTSVGALEDVTGPDEVPTWAITEVGEALLRADRSQQFGPPEAVNLEPQSGVAVSSSEATS